MGYSHMVRFVVESGVHHDTLRHHGTGFTDHASLANDGEPQAIWTYHFGVHRSEAILDHRRNIYWRLIPLG